jgi:hypothetical protein
MISKTDAQQRLISASDLPLFCTLSGKQLKHTGKHFVLPVPDYCPLNGEINRCSMHNKKG